MRSRIWFAFGLALVLVLPMTTAALAQTAGDQIIEVEVLEPGMLAIGVEQEFGLGSVVPGTTAGPHGFWMEVMNSTTDGWMVSVTGTDLQSFYWEGDEWGNTWRVIDPEGPTIAVNTIWVQGGAPSWGDPNPVTYAAGSLSSISPLEIMWGTSDAFGRIGFDGPSPEVWVNVPSEAAFGSYTATLTYTIQGVTS